MQLPGLKLSVWLLLVWLFRAQVAWSQPADIQTIISNGPPANRFNIVLLSEGYTSAQLTAFGGDATNILEALLAHPPYLEYRPYFNAFAISVPSVESGSDHPASGISVNTYFNSSYERSSDYLITVPPDSTGQGRVDALVKSCLPAADLCILLVNDPIPGGSDGAQKIGIVSRGSSPEYMSHILAHETGHVIGGLGDEYDSPFPGFPDVEEPNTTRETRREFIKWKHWLADPTPVPTPPLLQYSDTIGLFEGAHYHSAGWYRPKLNCTMHDNASPFCEVCAETLVLACCRRVRPVDSFTPAETNLTVTSPGTLMFSLALLHPASHSLTVRWFTNGVPVPAQAGPEFQISALLLGTGRNTVRASVTDPTALVRADPEGLLRQDITWSLEINIAQLELDTPLWLTGRKLAFRIRGTAPNGVVIQHSTNLCDWSSQSTNSLQNGECWYTNRRPEPVEAPNLYRVLARP